MQPADPTFSINFNESLQTIFDRRGICLRCGWDSRTATFQEKQKHRAHHIAWDHRKVGRILDEIDEFGEWRY